MVRIHFREGELVMKKFIMAVFLLFVTTAVFAKVRVVTTYPYIYDITKKIGGDKINVRVLSSGNADPHFIVPKPSFIAMVRNADLLILNGAELEIGWLPQIVRKSHNSSIKPGSEGFLDLSGYVTLIDIPVNVSRDHGDVHSYGNPHFNLDPRNIPKIANAIVKRLCDLDMDNSEYYKKNNNAFNLLWEKKLVEWKKAVSSLNGRKVVQYHKLFDYLFKYCMIFSVIELEPLPGIMPNPRHIKKVIDRIKSEGVNLIITDVYHSIKPAQLVSRKTGVRMIVLPQDVNAVEQSSDIVSLFDEIIRRLIR